MCLYKTPRHVKKDYCFILIFFTSFNFLKTIDLPYEKALPLDAFLKNRIQAVSLIASGECIHGIIAFIQVISIYIAGNQHHIFAPYRKIFARLFSRFAQLQ